MLNPDQNKVLCSYVGDSGSDMRRCSGGAGSAHCVPGCSEKGMDAGVEWWHRTNMAKGCSWSPQDLKDMMELTLCLRVFVG